MFFHGPGDRQPVWVCANAPKVSRYYKERSVWQSSDEDFRHTIQRARRNSKVHYMWALVAFTAGMLYAESCLDRPSISSDKARACRSNMVEDAIAFSICTYEENTVWGKQIGMLYGCAAEDVFTGFTIQSRGWKSTLYTPKREAFVGCAPVNLNDTLTQHKRWVTGLFELFASKFSTFLFGNIHIAQRLGYSFWCLWAPSSIHIICYGSVPALCMLSGISLYPKISDPWFLVFGFLSASGYAYSAIEFIYVGGGSLKRWWNEQRMWMIKSVSSYLFAFIQVVSKLMGISEVGFKVTSKIVHSEAAKRYEAEIFEFGAACPLFIPPATLALINLISLSGGIALVIRKGYSGVEDMFVQLMLSSFIVINSYPIYMGMFARKNKGRFPTPITLFSLTATVVACWTVLGGK